MHIFIDGDGCPVIRITEQVAQNHGLAVTIIVDNNHLIISDYSEVRTVDQGNDAADFVLIGLVHSGDLVITQDYGLASLALAKGAFALHQNGKEYSSQTIDILLMERHLSKQQRKSGSKRHYRAIPKRTTDDDYRYELSLENLLKRQLTD